MSTSTASVAFENAARIRLAAVSDAPALCDLLRAASLPLDGLPDSLEHFHVAEGPTGIVGAVGLEMYGPVALLRSAVVHPALRGHGVGEALITTALQYAEDRGVEDIVLLTTTAERWFPRFGFSRIGREDVPEAVQASAELRGACPASAVVMRRRCGPRAEQA